MVGAICNSFSYIVASPFSALLLMFCDKMGNHRRALAEVESPYFIFGGAVRLRKSCVLAHVLGPGFDQEGLEAAARIRDVVEDAPAARAIPAADTAELVYRPVELL